jgi:hypothetical protein
VGICHANDPLAPRIVLNRRVIRLPEPARYALRLAWPDPAPDMLFQNLGEGLEKGSGEGLLLSADLG